MTNVERRLWARIRGRQVAGFKFRRQAPIGPYFADFACLSERLVVEVDGDLHVDSRDDARDAWLDSEGYRVVRFAAQQIDEGLDEVVDVIYHELTSPRQGDSVPPPARLAARAGRPPRQAGR